MPPACETRLQLSSSLRPDKLDCFDLPSAQARAMAEAGQLAQLSPRDELTVVHAVSKPLLPLALQAGQEARGVGSTTVGLSGTVTCHPASTGRVDVVATWSEPVDDQTSDFRLEPRSSTAQHVEIPAGDDTVSWSSRLTLGDTRRRDLTIRPIGSSRFREYFRPEHLQTRTGEGDTLTVPNAARPAPPQVHSVLPTFRWTRTVTDGVYQATRRTVGVRVWLRRPWMQTGTGEQLGVVLFSTRSAGEAAIAARSRVADLATRYFSDPLQGLSSSALPPLDSAAVTNAVQPVRGFPLAEGVVGTDSAAIAGVEVRFDPDRKLWFADIDLAEIQLPRQDFLRLGLVRYQPESVTGCHISRVVVAELVQLPPPRTLVVSPRPDKLGVRVAVHGVAPEANFRYRTELVRRTSRSAELSVVQRLTVPVSFGGVLGGPPSGDDTGTLGVGDQALPDDLGGLDLVVREEWMGDYLHEDKRVARTTWFDLVPGERLAGLLGRPSP